MSRSGGVRSGRITYTGRAFRMDAQEAMGTDLVRGIIELVTNSDDAYERAGGGAGKIWIGVDHSYKADTRTLVVRDRAGGLPRDHAIERLTHIATRSSGFEAGQAVRGNRGRGAKDLIAFGDVEFETICEGYLTKLSLRRDGSWEEVDRKAAAEDRAHLHLHVRRGGGMQVTVHAERSFKVPRHDTLRHQIAHDFQLRDIMADPKREVLLDKLNDLQRASARLLYRLPAGLVELLKTTIAVPGYPQAGTIRLRVDKLLERCDAPPTDRTRPCGILVAGRRAIYDNTLLRFEGVPHAGWLTGRLECPYIDELARVYDDRDDALEPHPPDNPLQIISRRRHGLTPEHPFTRALYRAVEEQLAPLVAQLEEESRAHSRELESARNRRLLDRLGRDMARLMAESMREIDDEDDPGKRLSGPLPTIRIVPERVRLPIGETKGLSVVCNREGLEEGDEVLIELDPPGVAEPVDGELLALSPHRTRPEEGLSASVRLKGLKPEEAIVTASVNGRSDAALIIGCEPVVEDPAEPPASLEWEKPRLKVAVNKVKTVELRAPSDLVELHGPRVALSIDDEGVLLRTRAVTLDIDEDLGWFTANVRVEGRALGSRAKLMAELGDQQAVCRVNVTERDDGVPELRIEYSDEDPTAFRAYFDPPDPGPDGSQTLKILVRHAAVKQILRDDLSGQDSAGWLTLLPEIVCDTVVRRLMQRKHPISEELDAQTLYRDHADWHLRLLPGFRSSCSPWPAPTATTCPTAVVATQSGRSRPQRRSRVPSAPCACRARSRAVSCGWASRTYGAPGSGPGRQPRPLTASGNHHNHGHQARVWDDNPA